MLLFRRTGKNILTQLKSLLLLVVVFSSCTIIRKAPIDRPYLGKNIIEVTGGKFSKIEKSALLLRLTNQLDDSSKTKIKDVLFVLHFINRPPAYDSAYSNASARNMKASMFHLGYYNAIVTYKADTIGPRVNVHYKVETGRQTLIDTVSYRLRNPDLQQLALDNKDKSSLIKNSPATKLAVLAEVGRLVDMLDSVSRIGASLVAFTVSVTWPIWRVTSTRAFWSTSNRKASTVETRKLVFFTLTEYWPGSRLVTV